MGAKNDIGALGDVEIVKISKRGVKVANFSNYLGRLTWLLFIGRGARIRGLRRLHAAAHARVGQEG